LPVSPCGQGSAGALVGVQFPTIRKTLACMSSDVCVEVE
jgi:hypothetical protein